MKLKNLVAICLAVFGITMIGIVVVGLWINPGDKVVNTTPISVPETQTTTPTTQNTQTQSSQPTTSSTTPSTTKTTIAPSTTTKTTTGGSTTGGNTNQAPTPTPTPKPTPPACGTAGGTCTAAQVAAHNSQNNCWVIYGGNYYIVTSYVSQHPGGKNVFNSNTCGHDITAYLSGSQSSAGQTHHHSASAYNVLNSYKVGAVSG